MIMARDIWLGRARDGRFTLSCGRPAQRIELGRSATCRAECLAALLVSPTATPQRDSCRLPLRTASTTFRIESITS